MANFSEYGRWLSTTSPGEEVVISGMSGRFPSSKNIQEFRDNLFNKKHMITETSALWNLSHPEIPNRIGEVPNTDKFDAGFFGVHYRQANIMNTNMRKVLESAVEAVIDAGINPSELEGSRTGVFVGQCVSEMEMQTLMSVSKPQSFAVTGYFKSILAHRISYYLKLKGPSCVCDTACSSSANALELAYRYIRSGKCENAIVGGSHVIEHPGVTLQFYRLGVLSDDGTCRVFDQDASGYVRAGAVVFTFLQKSRNARRNYGEIVYCKVNCDGFKEVGITYPSKVAQQQLLTEVLNDSQMHPNLISFLEAHGTGTRVGDPEETEAIDNAIAKKRTKPLLVGSVKCSIGHTEPASGLCSIVKLIIAMETGYIAPNIHLKKIRKGLVGFEEGRMKAVTEITKLDGEDAVVAMNNFGFGGTNVHLLMRRFNKIKKLELPQNDIPRLICVSGRTEESVSVLLNDLNEKSTDVEYVGLLHQIFKTKFMSHNYRGFTILTKNGPIITSAKFYNQKPVELFVFFGHIRNSFHLIAQHLLIFPHFKEVMEKIQIISIKHGVNIFEAISTNNDKSGSYIFGEFAIKYGIIELLKLLEVNAKIMYNNSIGKLINILYHEKTTLEEAIFEVSEIAKNLDLKTLIKREKSQIKYSLPSGQGVNNINYFHNSSKNAKLLVISDQPLKQCNCNLYLRDNLLIILGKLYEEGLNPQIHKLYPQIQFPVARNTPMLSPLLKWNYKKNWYTYKFTGYDRMGTLQQKYNLSYTMYKEQEYIKGHVINERNLIPATEYLYLVWQTIAKNEHLLPEDVSVVFENCKFIRAVTMPKTDTIQLTVSIHRGSGNFEVIEKNSVVVTGTVSKLENRNIPFSDLRPLTISGDDPKEILEQDEIYRELYLRGYNYSGLFKGIVKCNADASVGLVQWENNWTTFMDKMLQMSILQTDSKLLYVPVSIKKLIIIPQVHKTFAEGQKDKICPVYCYKKCNVFKSGGIEISGLRASSISRRTPSSEPVLEKYVFVPNVLETSLEESVRINTQIILENTLEHNFEAVEIVDEFTEPNCTFILPLVDKATSDLPLITADLTISTRSTLSEITNVKITNYVFTSSCNLLLVTGTKLLQRVQLLREILNAIKPNGFILTREDKSFVFEKTENLEIFTEHITDVEKLILLKKCDTSSTAKFIEISSDHFEWLPDLQENLKKEQNVVVYSNNELEGIIGLVNCIRREPKGNKIQCLFMMDNVFTFDPQNPFYQEQLKKNMAVNIYKDKSWGTYRHINLEDVTEVASPHCFVNCTVKGDLSSLKWLEGPLNELPKLEKDKILVYPNYAAINFRDIMTASGRVNIDAITTNRIEQEFLQGIEFCGRDVNGRRVMGMTTGGAITTMVHVSSTFLWDIPNYWSLEEASTVTVVYATVIYALLWVIKLKPGMSILIHSATGGIGLAALNVCLYHGCKIFVTVGTKKKRDYLKKHFPQIPDNHIGNSRDTSFEEMIKTGTESHGVDVVLNSLSEEKLMASIRCLAQGGDFLEIGKFDLGIDTFLKMLLMVKGINYHGVMLDRIIAESPQIKNWIVNKLYEGINAGYVKPLPRKVFNRYEVEEAFRYMMTGNHIGKVIIKVRNEDESVLFKGIPRFYCHSEKSYIIVGGLGGFGLELADWLFLRGAKKLILVSRFGITSGHHTRKIRNWNSYGVTVKVSMQDVTTEEGCINLIKEASELGVVDGVFNLAVVLKDALFEDQTEENFCISVAPKARATTYMDRVTRAYCPHLRYFVVFSSVSCGRGNIGQTNYGMANSVMERICEKRKREGFPATAIQWGAVGDVGLVAKMQKENKELVIGGTLQQKISSCLEVLDRLLRQDNAIVASMVVAEKKTGHGAESALGSVANILGIKDLKTISPHTPLAELGMDSMTATEVIQILEKEYDIYVTPKEIRSFTFAKLAEMEKEKRLQEQNDDKVQIGALFLIQHIPDNKANHLSILKLSDNVDENSVNILVLPGTEGVFQPFDFLTKNIKANVWGLQYNYHCPENSIQEMAEAIVSNIESNLTIEKLHTIIGYSFGSIVSLEVASLLEQKGYEGNVLIIDGSPNYLKSAIKENASFENELELQSLVIYRLMEMLLPLEVAKEQKERLFKCQDLNEMAELALNLIPENSPHKGKLEKQAAFTLCKRIKLLLNYKFDCSKIKAKVFLIKAKYPIISVPENDYSLSNYCEKPVQVFTVDGDHMSILQQRELIDIINKCI